MMKMKPRIDRDHVLRMEARRRAIEGCLHSVPDLLRPEEALGTPVREGDRIVIPVCRSESAAEIDALGIAVRPPLAFA